MSFCNFGKLKSLVFLNLFISEYLGMKGDEIVFFSKVPDWKRMLMLKTKSKQNPASPNREQNTIFEHIIISKVKKAWINH